MSKENSRSKIRQDIKKQKTMDIYSMVDTTIHPFGTNFDEYSIVGIIKRVDNIINPITMEEIYSMKVLCKGVMLNVCINKRDLFGYPYKGARFKGNIWLQGYVDFNNYY